MRVEADLSAVAVAPVSEFCRQVGPELQESVMPQIVPRRAQLNRHPYQQEQRRTELKWKRELVVVKCFAWTPCTET